MKKNFKSHFSKRYNQKKKKTLKIKYFKHVSIFIFLSCLQLFVGCLLNRNVRKSVTPTHIKISSPNIHKYFAIN